MQVQTPLDYGNPLMGESWKCKTDSLRIPALGVNSIAGDPLNDSILYISTGNSTTAFGQTYGQGILKSEDEGNTWQTTSLSWNPSLDEVAVKVIIDGSQTLMVNNNITSKTVYAITSFNVFKSDDGGLTFNPIKDKLKDPNNPIYDEFTNRFFRDIEISKGDPSTIFLCTNTFDTNGRKAAVYMSRDKGLSFSEITPSGLVVDGFYLATTNAKPNRIYIQHPQNNNLATIRWSDDWGQSWGSMDMPTKRPDEDGSDRTISIGDFLGVFEVNDANENIIYSGNQLLAKFTSSTNQFTRICDYWPGNTHADIRALQIYSSSVNGQNDILIMGNDGGVNKSSTGGQPQSSWLMLNGSGMDIDQDGKPDDLVITQVFDLGTSNFSQIPYFGTGNQDNGYIFTTG